jgi:hypothetical protein
MDDEGIRKMRQKVQAELIGCVKLASLPLSKKVSREIVEDRIRLLEFFKLQSAEKELELDEALLRLLMNYVKMASYNGVLKGFRIERQAAELRKDKARYHLCVFLQKRTKLISDSQKARLTRTTPHGLRFRLHGRKLLTSGDCRWRWVSIGRTRSQSFRRSCSPT